ncbi:hypothetical protein HRU45_04715 [Candidatus Dependentiae bacterium]|nr:hypothetical protein [Candidatus Dependentiae bacterium]
MGLQKKAGTASREMDIIIPTRYIECKNVNWQRFSFDAPQMENAKQAFMHQNTIAKNNNKIFEIHSKHSFTESWQTWLKEQGIKYIEG